MKRVVISEVVLVSLKLMDDYADEHALLDMLVKYGKGEEVDRAAGYQKVKNAFDFLIHPQRVDQVFIDDKDIFH